MGSQLVCPITFHKQKNLIEGNTVRVGDAKGQAQDICESAHFLPMKKILPVLLLTGLVHQMSQKTVKTTSVLFK